MTASALEPASPAMSAVKPPDGIVRLLWATDLHLPHARGAGEERLRADLARRSGDVDAVVLTGDISEAETLARDLRRLHDAAAPTPVYFVLGNHDFYGGSIRKVRDRAAELAERVGGLGYLTCSDAVSPGPGVALLGHDGWGDARTGNWRTTPVELNDFRLIEEISSLSRDERIRRLRALGDEAAGHLERTLRDALSGHDHAVVATHVPPFSGAAWHEGGRSGSDWLPYFVGDAAGRALLRVAGNHPGSEITVLCGHTHSGGEIRAAPNVLVRTGRAEYGRPALDGIVTAG